MKSILFMTFTIGCCLSSRGQQKWIGVWQTGTKKLVHSYATKLDGLDINKITTNSRNVNEAGLWLVCIVNSESQILRNDSIISRSDYEPEPYYVNGFYWDGVIGDKNSKYRELPDGHWFRYHTWSNPKKNYLEWDKTVINGLIEGIVNVYDSNRKIESVSEYKRGLRSGFSLFYSEGTVREISYYQNGTFLEDIILYENQQLNSSRTINDAFRTWNKKGVLTSYSEVDSNLRPVGKILKYYDDGSIMVSGQAKGLKNGVWKYFNKDGTLNHEEIWDNGVVK